MNKTSNIESNKEIFSSLKKNIELYYEDGFIVREISDGSMLSIVHSRDDFFKVVMSKDKIICDFVLTAVVEYNKERDIVKISCEIGTDDRESGFVSHIVNPYELYPIFFITYDGDDLEDSPSLASEK